MNDLFKINVSIPKITSCHQTKQHRSHFHRCPHPMAVCHRLPARGLSSGCRETDVPNAANSHMSFGNIVPNYNKVGLN